ncbi:MAG: hypothetical protein FWG79_04370 [Bacteroidales bacterium]|nr:hypothetical protein [Bacteroidales bacterium]
MKKITLILVFATFATKSFAHCPIPQWCPSAPLHQTLCPGEQIDPIEFPSVIGKTLIINWWTDGTRFASINTPDGIIVSGPPENREHSAPVIIRGTPTATGTHHYTVSNTCGVELLHGSITLNAPIPSIPGTITFSNNPVCTGAEFTASIAAVSGAATYNWTIPGSMTHDGSDGTTIDITDAGTTTDSLAISVTATNACGTSSPSTANITIDATPATPGTITFSPTSVGTGGAFTASVGAVAGATSYTWTVPAGMTSNNSTNNTLNVTNAGTTTGARTFSVTANNTTCGASAATSGDITVTIPIPTCIGTPGNLTLCTGAINVASPGTVSWQGSTNIETYARTISGNGITQVWSGFVTTSNCNNRAIFTSNSTVTDCRNSINGFSGDYFNFCFVLRHAAALCPSPWRVPTCQDFIHLDVALGGTGYNRQAGGTGNADPASVPSSDKTIEAQIEWYIGATGSGNPASNNIESTWGGSRFTAYTDDLTHVSSRHWSSSQSSGTNAFSLGLSTFSLNPQNTNGKTNGFALRCVRDVP